MLVVGFLGAVFTSECDAAGGLVLGSVISCPAFGTGAEAISTTSGFASGAGAAGFGWATVGGLAEGETWGCTSFVEGVGLDKLVWAAEPVFSGAVLGEGVAVGSTLRTLGVLETVAEVEGAVVTGATLVCANWPAGGLVGCSAGTAASNSNCRTTPRTASASAGAGWRAR